MCALDEGPQVGGAEPLPDPAGHALGDGFQLLLRQRVGKLAIQGLTARQNGVLPRSSAVIEQIPALAELLRDYADKDALRAL